MLLLAIALLGEPTSRLAIIRVAPEFTLTTQDEKSLQFADLKGKVRLVSFIFTTCNGSCPATTHRMAQLQQELKTRGFDKDDRIRLVSITLDPAKDTPEVLRGYMKLFDLDPVNWSFLTGEPDKVTKAFTDWGMWVRPTENAQLDHPSRVFLVDQKGRIRDIYNLGFFKAPWVLEDIKLLLNER